MIVAMGLYYAPVCDEVFLRITDGELLASFEVRNPLWDWQANCLRARVMVGGETWGLALYGSPRLQIIRPNGESVTDWTELLQRFGHRMSEGVSHG